MGLDHNVQEGMEIPPVTYGHCDRLNMIRMALFLHDANPVHLDRGYATEHGLPDVIQQGNLNTAFLLRAVKEWVGSAGKMERMVLRLKANVHPGDILTNSGRVLRRYRDGDGEFVECAVSQQSSRGWETLSGAVTIRLV